MSLPRPLLSVVVPARDHHALTRRCVESVLRECGTLHVELLIVDDGSEVPVRQALGELATRDREPADGASRGPGVEIRIVRHDRSAGFAAAANTGLRAARAPLLLLLNNDAELEPGAVRALVDAFERDPRLGVAGGQLYYPDGTPQWSGGRRPSLLWLFAMASGLPAGLGRIPGYRRLRPVHKPAQPLDWVTGAALALRREAWLQAGPFDQGLGAYAQDLDLCLRAKEAGWAVGVLPDVRVLHHHGATTAGSAPGSAGREHPEKLWTSLLAWCHKQGGAARLRRARLAFVLGGRVRLALRALGRPFVASPAAADYDHATGSYRAALRAVVSYAPARPATGSPAVARHRAARANVLDSLDRLAGGVEQPSAVEARRRIGVARLR
jgi:N-acetylglucosaminyl-diphospho-decaprenol L-rhamnosyltransferase